MHFLPKLYLFLQDKKMLRYPVKFLKALSILWMDARTMHFPTYVTITESFRDQNRHEIAWVRISPGQPNLWLLQSFYQ